jgi:hypothetical protein
VVGSAITSDEPASGVVKIIDKSDANEPEALLRYSSWDTSTFTLAASVTGSATATETDTNLLTDGGADFGGTDDVRIGDVIRDITGGGWGFVVEIVSTTQLRTIAAPGQTLAWASADSYETNRLPFDTTISDWVYVPFFAAVATGGSVSNSYIYSADVYARFVFRLIGYKPFTSNQLVGSNGLSVAAVRTEDSVVTVP